MSAAKPAASSTPAKAAAVAKQASDAAEATAPSAEASKRKRSDPNGKAVRKAAGLDSQPQSLGSSQPPHAPAMATDIAEDAIPLADLAAPSAVLHSGTRPRIAQTSHFDYSKVKRPAAARRPSASGSGKATAFSARTLSDLMEDVPLLEALKDLLSSLQPQQAPKPAASEAEHAMQLQQTPSIALPEGTHGLQFQQAPGSTLPEAAQGLPMSTALGPAVINDKSSAGAAHEPAGPSCTDPGLLQSAVAEQHRRQGDLAATQLAGLPEAGQAEVKPQPEPSTAEAPMPPQATQPNRQDAKRLRGKAAVLAKALGLDVKGVVKLSSAPKKPGHSNGSLAASVCCCDFSTLEKRHAAHTKDCTA